MQKNIPSDILKSFGELTKSEDIFTGTVKTVLNWVNCTKGSDACQEKNKKNKNPQSLNCRISMQMACGKHDVIKNKCG